MAPTQLYGATLAGGSELEFTQVFGGATAPDAARLLGDWHWAYLNEGARALLDLWWRNKVRKLASTRGVEVTGADQEVTATRIPHRRIDSRMSCS